MRVGNDPRELCLALTLRSSCKEKCAAVLDDGVSIFGWGWNHAINGIVGAAGKHAEEHAIERANPKRLRGSRLTVAARRGRTGTILCARPCDGHKKYRKAKKTFCFDLALKHGIRTIQYSDPRVPGGWVVMKLY